ncbi:alkylglycerol monooxygenase-like [Acanthaster planci]|uniref:Alkylglycerol monooxygenase n=1 Tax=Acanthaster planci TaxID=133434 RepID=A0A8B7XM70_ACAPL|nr:alkylglycerol monooxygenase-like [Acanthaster planci]
MPGLFNADVLTGTRRLFYAVTPNETSFENLEDVPDYFYEAIPFFGLLALLEMIVTIADKKVRERFFLPDSISSLTAGMLLLLTQFLSHGVNIGFYVWVHENYRLATLAWDSPWTWIICFVLVDLGYYWMHRMSHEVNIFWAAHQVHHSSEEYNLTTALRQSICQRFVSWMFYLPLAFAIPPPIFMMHQQFNTLYQFWIHTRVIKSLGPLEYILNTPSHHRVHHGRNRYCIDKNYAGTLIIWDRMFGTFEPESEPVVFGLVHPLESYNPLYTQYCHYKYILETAWNMPGLTNKLWVFLKGPGWMPGLPRQGSIEDIPDIHYPMPKYRPRLPHWSHVYIIIHFAVIFYVYDAFMTSLKTLSQTATICGMTYIIFSLTCLGAINDAKPAAPFLEVFRSCLVLVAEAVAISYLPIMQRGSSQLVFYILRLVFGLSVVVWLPKCVSVLTQRKNKAE